MDRLNLISDILSVITPFILAFIIGWILLQLVRGR